MTEPTTAPAGLRVLAVDDEPPALGELTYLLEQSDGISEVVGVRIPFLCIQPLVENAVRHGFENTDGPGTITITARDRGADALISVEDDGAGIDPAVVRRSLSGDPGDHVGLANVDERLRSTFGDDRGLVVETAPGAGTRITMRIPKYAEAVTVDD